MADVDKFGEILVSGVGAVQLPTPITLPPRSSAVQAVPAWSGPIAATAVAGDLAGRLLEAGPDVETAISTEACCCCDRGGGRDEQAYYDDVESQLKSSPHGRVGVDPVR